MPYKEKETEKIYWAIGEVSQMLDIAHSTLRFWETEFDSIQPKKNKKGDRFYRKADIENLKLIKHLLKDKGFTLKGAKEKMKKTKGEDEKNLQAIETLKKIKEFLIQIKNEV